MSTSKKPAFMEAKTMSEKCDRSSAAAIRSEDVHMGLSNTIRYCPEVIWNAYTMCTDEQFASNRGIYELHFIKCYWSGQASSENLARVAKFMELLRGYREDVATEVMTIGQAVEKAYNGRIPEKKVMTEEEIARQKRLKALLKAGFALAQALVIVDMKVEE